MTENGRLSRAIGVNHVALEVDDVEASVAFYSRLFDLRGVARAGGGAFLDFRDPFGNRVQIVQYDQIRFLKAPGVLAGLGVPGLGKTEAALAELRSNGLA